MTYERRIMMSLGEQYNKFLKSDYMKDKYNNSMSNL
jgi:hypothetical protein